MRGRGFPLNARNKPRDLSSEDVQDWVKVRGGRGWEVRRETAPQERW